MDNSEFETRAFADPDDSNQDFLDALMGSPERQVLVNDIRAFNARLGSIANNVAIPEDLRDRLRSTVNAQDSSQEPDASAAAEQVIPRGVAAGAARQDPLPGTMDKPPGTWQPTRMLAMAAALVLAVGVTWTSMFSNQPSAAEIEFGQQVVDHIYMELDEIASSPAADLQQVNQVFSAVGGSVPDERAVTNLQISFAKRCVVIPQNSSAHVVMQGRQGPVNIIIINNTPVQQEFRLTDDRFDAVVVPLATGNLILVGEKNESLGDFHRVLNDNVTWTI